MQKALNGGKIQLYTYIFIYIHFFYIKITAHHVNCKNTVY